ncbi:MAG: hypothetical protein WC465_00730 [Patescibacteria group bacterium]
MGNPNEQFHPTAETGQDGKSKNIGTNQLRLDMAEGRLAEVEAYLDHRHQNPTPNQNERWWEGMMVILYHKYEDRGDADSLQRIMDKLPENIQVALQKHDEQ